MPETTNKIMHMIVTSWNGDVVHREVVRQSQYPEEEMYRSAIQITYRKLTTDYPKGNYHVNIVSSGSTSPIALQSSSS